MWPVDFEYPRFPWLLVRGAALISQQKVTRDGFLLFEFVDVLEPTSASPGLLGAPVGPLGFIEIA